MRSQKLPIANERIPHHFSPMESLALGTRSPSLLYAMVGFNPLFFALISILVSYVSKRYRVKNRNKGLIILIYSLEFWEIQIVGLALLPDPLAWWIGLALYLDLLTWWIGLVLMPDPFAWWIFLVLHLYPLTWCISLVLLPDPLTWWIGLALQLDPVTWWIGLVFLPDPWPDGSAWSLNPLTWCIGFVHLPDPLAWRTGLVLMPDPLAWWIGLVLQLDPLTWCIGLVLLPDPLAWWIGLALHFDFLTWWIDLVLMPDSLAWCIGLVPLTWCISLCPIPWLDGSAWPFDSFLWLDGSAWPFCPIPWLVLVLRTDPIDWCIVLSWGEKKKNGITRESLTTSPHSFWRARPWEPGAHHFYNDGVEYSLEFHISLSFSPSTIFFYLLSSRFILVLLLYKFTF